MLGSQVLDVAIGLGFIYFLFSLVITTFNEWIANLFAMRAKTLEEGIRKLLNDSEMADSIFEHHLVNGLMKKSWLDKLRRKVKCPSYIPARTFALALLDIAGRKDINQTDYRFIEKIFLDIQSRIDELSGTEDVKTNKVFPVLKILSTFGDIARKDVQKMLQSVENWYDDAMERVSGWYKRKTQLITLIMSLVICGVLNIDSFTIGNVLWKDPVLRATAIKLAEQNLSQKEMSDPPSTSVTVDSLLIDSIKKAQAGFQELQLPMGWNLSAKANDKDPRGFPRGLGWIYKILGLLFTSIALCLGAPFWFDTLNLFINLRSAGNRPGKESKVEKKSNRN